MAKVSIKREARVFIENIREEEKREDQKWKQPQGHVFGKAIEPQKLMLQKKCLIIQRSRETKFSVLLIKVVYIFIYIRHHLSRHLQNQQFLIICTKHSPHFFSLNGGSFIMTVINTCERHLSWMTVARQQLFFKVALFRPFAESTLHLLRYIFMDESKDHYNYTKYQSKAPMHSNEQIDALKIAFNQIIDNLINFPKSHQFSLQELLTEKARQQIYQQLNQLLEQFRTNTFYYSRQQFAQQLPSSKLNNQKMGESSALTNEIISDFQNRLRLLNKELKQQKRQRKDEMQRLLEERQVLEKKLSKEIEALWKKFLSEIQQREGRQKKKEREKREEREEREERQKRQDLQLYSKDNLVAKALLDHKLMLQKMSQQLETTKRNKIQKDRLEIIEGQKKKEQLRLSIEREREQRQEQRRKEEEIQRQQGEFERNQKQIRLQPSETQFRIFYTHIFPKRRFFKRKILVTLATSKK